LFSATEEERELKAVQNHDQRGNAEGDVISLKEIQKGRGKTNIALALTCCLQYKAKKSCATQSEQGRRSSWQQLRKTVYRTIS